MRRRRKKNKINKFHRRELRESKRKPCTQQSGCDVHKKNGRLRIVQTVSWHRPLRRWPFHLPGLSFRACDSVIQQQQSYWHSRLSFLPEACGWTGLRQPAVGHGACDPQRGARSGGRVHLAAPPILRVQRAGCCQAGRGCSNCCHGGDCPWRRQRGCQPTRRRGC